MQNEFAGDGFCGHAVGCAKPAAGQNLGRRRVGEVYGGGRFLMILSQWYEEINKDTGAGSLGGAP